MLELACGTGLWTRHLVRYASTLTAVDGSEEVLAINRARVDRRAVRYIQADLFDWTPPEGGYDACVFSFWLSHVPRQRFAAFWEMVARALRPGGRVLFIDSARTDRSTASTTDCRGPDEATMTRRLDDGREFRIVKRFYRPARAGVRARVPGVGVSGCRHGRVLHLRHGGEDVAARALYLVWSKVPGKRARSPN